LGEGNTVRDRDPETVANGGLGELHPAEIKFLKLTREMRNGKIKELKVQDGLPTFGEETVILKTHKFI
jgi:hypothetical protein